MRKFVLLSMLVLISLTGCGGGQTPQAAPETPAAAVEIKATAPEQAPAGGSPATQSGPVPTVITTIPAPGEDTGIVTGVVFSTNVNAPLSSVGVYLGEYMYMTPGPDYMVTMREQGSPHTLADSNGRFVIDNVPPGKYPLLLWTPFNSKVVPDEKHEKELVVTVEAGKVTDLGEIRIEFP